MSRRIKPKEKYVRISMNEIWRNLDGPPRNNELWNYVVRFEFSMQVLSCLPRLPICFDAQQIQLKYLVFRQGYLAHDLY